MKCVCVCVCFVVDLFQQLKFIYETFFFHREKVVEDGEDVEEEAPKYITDSLLCLFVCLSLSSRGTGYSSMAVTSLCCDERKKSGETKT